MSKFVLFVFLVCFNSSSIYAQQYNFSKELKFAKYLQNNDLNEEALFVLKQIDTLHLLQFQKDSLHYEIGWLYYSIKNLDSAILFLGKVSKQDVRFTKATFFKAYCYAFLKDFNNSLYTLSSIDDIDTTNLEKLKNLQYAGTALLKRNSNNFQKFAKNFSFNQFYIKQEEANLIAYANKIFNRKSKSPFIAATLSSILPGSGKWYAGKKKQAIGAFLPILSSALLTIEAYNKGGFKDARFWIYGSIFTTFYIGNIWGSALTVKIKNKEFNDIYDNKILFDMHIPLRNFFN